MHAEGKQKDEKATTLPLVCFKLVQASVPVCLLACSTCTISMFFKIATYLLISFHSLHAVR